MSKATFFELPEIGQRISEQDNAMTSNPAFLVQVEHRVYGSDLCNPDGYIFVDKNDIENIAETKKGDALENLRMEDPLNVLLNDWDRYEYEIVWIMKQAMFTRDAAQHYIDTNLHNLRNPRIYVESGFRNFEWHAIRDYLASLSRNQQGNRAN